MEKFLALVVLASGAEEMEVTIVVDVLRRAGIEVVLAGLESAHPIICSRRVKIVPDVALQGDLGDFDVVVLPGGAEGARRLAESSAVGELLQKQERSGKLVAAICAAPTVLKAHAVFAGYRMTAYPSFRETLLEYAQFSDERVVQDRSLITSRGPGTAFDFALTIIERLAGARAAADVRAGLVL